MEKNKKDNKKNQEIDEINTGKEEILRITVSRIGERSLSEITEKVNDGFLGGKVSKVQMANWILKRFRDDLDDSMIKDIRADHYDELMLLESILKKARETGQVPMEFKHLLQKQIGLDVSAKKKPKQALTEDCINDVV